MNESDPIKKQINSCSTSQMITGKKSEDRSLQLAIKNPPTREQTLVASHLSNLYKLKLENTSSQ